MATRADQKRWTFEEYFAWEANQEEKHEFYGGIVYRRNLAPVAMVGVAIRHGRVVTNLQSLLTQKLRGTGCDVYGPEIRLRITAEDAAFYPDAFIACVPTDPDDHEIVDAASVVFEVLSPSTGAYDLGDKFRAYIKLQSLRAYFLVDPVLHKVEAYFRENERWVLRTFARGSDIEIPVAGIAISFDMLFEGVPAKEHPFQAADIVSLPNEIAARRRRD